jgi:hypothetical protein
LAPADSEVERVDRNALWGASAQRLGVKPRHLGHERAEKPPATLAGTLLEIYEVR